MNPRLIMLLVMLSSAVLGIVGGIPMMLRKIPPNGFIGIRTPTTFSDPDIWYKTNAYAGRYMVWSNSVLVALIIAAYFLHSVSDIAYCIVMTVGLVLMVVVLCVISVLYPRSIGR